MRLLVIGGCDAGAKHAPASGEKLEQLHVTRKPSLVEDLEALHESTFQLVLLNLALPDTSAREAVKKILSMARDLPVIAFLNGSGTPIEVEGPCGSPLGRILNDCPSEWLIHTIRYAIERKQLMVDRKADQQLTTKEDGQLLAHLSHEFRNALTCIFQFGNILRGGLAGALSEEQGEYLGIMLDNASRIRRVLDELTEVSPADSECANNNGPYSGKAT